MTDIRTYIIEITDQLSGQGSNAGENERKEKTRTVSVKREKLRVEIRSLLEAPKVKL